MSRPEELVIRRFAHIGEVQVRFGDLTVLVGAQATGKTLALEWLKVALDGKQIVERLRDAGQRTSDPEILIDLIFGAGMAPAWRGDSEIRFNGSEIKLAGIRNRGKDQDRVFYIPAQRSMLISDGWAAPFQRLTAETPVVARIFSQNLYDQFRHVRHGVLFPRDGILKKEYRKLIAQAVYRGGEVTLEETPLHTRRLRLRHADVHLPFMSWTAGQREFTPLLLGLHHLLPSGKKSRRGGIEWVIIEEPELGLHPEAIRIILVLVLELLSRGYRVVVSTHSPQMLDAVWMLRNLAEMGGDAVRVCQAFEVSARMKDVARKALEKDYRVYYFHVSSADGTVVGKDISALDPGAEDTHEADWGGLTRFATLSGEAVREAAVMSD